MVLRMLLALCMCGCENVYVCAAEPRVLALTSQQGAGTDQGGLVERRVQKNADSLISS